MLVPVDCEGWVLERNMGDLLYPILVVSDSLWEERTTVEAIMKNGGLEGSGEFLTLLWLTWRTGASKLDG